jgi:hypothetical protein
VVRASANKALKGIMNQNLILDSEDVVFVPKKPIADLKYLADIINSVGQAAEYGNIGYIATQNY